MYLSWFDRVWPSGKATGSGPVIGGSNPSTLAIRKLLRRVAAS